MGTLHHRHHKSCVGVAHCKGSGLLKKICGGLGNQGSRDPDGRFDCETVHLSVHHSSQL